MKTWQIPAKTFLLGEYVALVKGPALILTTSPCFELSLVRSIDPQTDMHSESPAGLWWALNAKPEHKLAWKDPWQGKGGLGASSAQFIGAYLASRTCIDEPVDKEDLYNQFCRLTYQTEGIQPSGYDLLAQMHKQCVYINQNHQALEMYLWPFTDLSFLLIHSGQKLATHEHLKSLRLPDNLSELSTIVESGRQAFQKKDSQALIDAVNNYQTQLEQNLLVCQNSLSKIHSFKKQPHILAAKGCGAMGADILLLLVPSTKKQELVQSFLLNGIAVLATEDNLYTPFA